MKYFTNVSIGFLSMLLLGCGHPEDPNLTPFEPLMVKTAIAKPGQEEKTISVSGRIEAGNSANISTRVMGNVTSIRVQPGDKVKEGQLLLVMSNTDLIAKKSQVEASVKQAASALENARKDMERFRNLYDRGSATPKELENMTTRYEVAESGLEVAKQMKEEVLAQFTYTNIRAPFTGIVANTFVKVGDIANPGMPLATVEGLATYEALVLIPESQISEIQVGMDAIVQVKSRRQTLQGQVKEVSPSAKNTGGQFLAKIALKDDLTGILPGMFVNAEILVGSSTKQKTSPTVSENALIRKGQLTGLYTLTEDNVAILRWIRTGNSKAGNIEVLSGLSEGETYILEAEGKLFNGASVILN